MNELALFCGAGGGLLGTRLLEWHPVCGVEIDPYCREVVIRRQEEGHLEPFPIWDDVRTFDGLPWRGKVDVVSAGFPCQPFSTAGKGEAENDPRNMWPETIRIIREVQPTFALLENVPGLISKRYFGTILGEISEAGFDAVWDVVSAAETGAPHLRKRLWILAYSNGFGGSQRRRDQQCSWKRQPKAVSCSSSPGKETVLANTTSPRLDPGEGRTAVSSRNKARLSKPKRCGHGCDGSDTQCDGCKSRRDINGKHDGDLIGPVREYVPDTRSEGLPITQQEELQGTGRRFEGGAATECGWWSAEPDVGRVVNGMANRVDRLKSIGNGQVPSVVVAAWRLLTNGI